eukprot:m.266574 g.266574  ORF g.266574 m.266574 type:complete len:831 (+) comp40502_c0_seq5:23-2515(+)
MLLTAVIVSLVCVFGYSQLSASSPIVIVEDPAGDFITNVIVDLIVKHAQETSGKQLIVEIDRLNKGVPIECSVIRGRNSIHLTSKCLDLDNAPPPVILLSSGLQIGVGHSVEGQLKVALEFARHRGWRQLQLWTDDSEAGSAFVGLSFRSPGDFQTSVYPMCADETSAFHKGRYADAVFVHCLTLPCISAFRAGFDAWKVSGVGWVLTEDVTLRVQSDVAFRRSVSHADAFGIKRIFPRDHLWQFIESSKNCTLLSECAENIAERLLANAVYFHDGLLLLIQLLAQFNESLPVQSDFAHNIPWASPIQLDSRLKGRVHNFYEVIDLADPFYGKVASYGNNELSFTDVRGGNVRSRRGTEECSPPKGPPYHLRVSTVEEPPFLFYNRSPDDPLFTGFVVDLLDELKERLNFTYELALSTDRKYGVFEKFDNGTVTSNGLVGEVFNCVADLGVAAIAISAGRETYLQFTTPWMDYGLMLLGPKPRPVDSGLFAFLNPFTTSTWLLTIASLLVAVVALPLLQVISPSQLQRENEEEEENGTLRSFRSKLYDSLWVFFTTAMQQGPDGAFFLPAKVLFAVWYFFILIIVATYTANLAAFLTFQKIPNEITNVDQLAAQTAVLYGTVQDTAVAEFFHDSDIKIYSEMSKFMKGEAGSMMSSGFEGFKRSQDDSKRGYVFIWDSPVLEYFSTQKPCNTTLIGRPFNTKGYGIAMRKGMPYHDDFNLEILRLRESGWVKRATGKWLDAAQCAEETLTDSSDTGRIYIADMAGVFLVLAVGICVAFLVAILQRIGVKCSCLQLEDAFTKRRSQMKHAEPTVDANGTIEVTADDPITAV